LYDSGVSAVEAIQILYDNSNKYMRSHLGRMLSAGHRKKNLDEMLDTGLIDKETMSKIAMVFKLPNFSELLSFVAKGSIDHTERKLAKIGNIIRFVLMFVVAIILLLTAVSIPLVAVEYLGSVS
jgi:type II secretory pathway component PulF